MSIDERERQGDLVASALRAWGEDCESVYDFVNGMPFRNKNSIDALIGLLPIITDDRIKEGIVRALNDPMSRGKAEKSLVREFKSLPMPSTPSSHSVQWAIGATLGSLDMKLVTDDLLEIASDRRYGSSRQMIVHSLNRLREGRVIPLLIDLLQDESVRGHAITALRKAGAKSAVEFIEEYVSDKNPWIRRTAKSALASLRK
jgi:hypothetical protein